MDNQYSQYLAETNKSRTLRTRLRRIKKPLAQVKHLEPRLATPELVRASYLEWAEGKSPRTAKSGITELKALWKWLVEEKHTKGNPWLTEKELTRLPRMFKGKPNVVKPTHSEEEAAALYQHLLEGAKADPRSKEMVALLGLAMGLRVGEVLAVTPKAVRKHKLFVKDGKTGDREQVMPSDVHELVHTAIRGLGEDEVVWPYTNNMVFPWLRNLCEELGAQRLGMHALRRTNATVMAAAGEDPDVIRKRLGHTNFNGMTRKHYIKRGTLEDVNTTKVVKLLESRSK